MRAELPGRFGPLCAVSAYVVSLPWSTLDLGLPKRLDGWDTQKTSVRVGYFLPNNSRQNRRDG